MISDTDSLKRSISPEPKKSSKRRGRSHTPKKQKVVSSKLSSKAKAKSPVGRGPKSPSSQGQKSPVNHAPKSPLKRRPKSPAPLRPKSPLSRGPKSPAPQGPKSPVARTVKSPVVKGPKSPVDSNSVSPPPPTRPAVANKIKKKLPNASETTAVKVSKASDNDKKKIPPVKKIAPIKKKTNVTTKEPKKISKEKSVKVDGNNENSDAESISNELSLDLKDVEKFTSDDEKPIKPKRKKKSYCELTIIFIISKFYLNTDMKCKSFNLAMI